MKPTDDAGIGASLAERLAFERLLADPSVTHASVPGERVVEEIEHGLGRLNAFLDYRYLYYDQSSDRLIQDLAVSRFALGANFRC